MGMRRVSSTIRFATLTGVLVVGACTARPATPAGAADAADSVTRDRMLWAAESLRVAALVHNDTASLSRVYADEFTMVTSAGEVRTKADQLREIATGVLLHPAAGAPTPHGPAASSSRQSRPEDEHVLARHLYAGATVGVVVSENTAPVVRGTDTATVRRRNTRVYVWRDGRWQLVSNHISRVAEPGDAPPGTSSDSAAVAALEQRIESAVVAREMAFLDSVYTPDFRVRHSTGDLDTRTQWIASVQRSRFASRQVDSLDVEVHGDVAFTTGRLHVRRTPEDPGWAKNPRWREYTVRYARVYVRRGGRWHLLTHHSTGESFGPLR